MSYIEDVELEDGICRVYGFSDENLAADALANGHADWFTKSQLQCSLGVGDAICRAVDTWQRREIVRGKGGVQSESASI